MDEDDEDDDEEEDEKLQLPLLLLLEPLLEPLLLPLGDSECAEVFLGFAGGLGAAGAGFPLCAAASCLRTKAPGFFCCRVCEVAEGKGRKGVEGTNLGARGTARCLLLLLAAHWGESDDDEGKGERGKRDSQAQQQREISETSKSDGLKRGAQQHMGSTASTNAREERERADSTAEETPEAAAAAQDAPESSDSDSSDSSSSGDMGGEDNNGEGNGDGHNDDDGEEEEDDIAAPEPLADIETNVDDEHRFSIACVTAGIGGETTTTVKAKLSPNLKGMATPIAGIVRLCPFGPDPRMILCNLRLLKRLLSLSSHLVLAPLSHSCLRTQSMATSSPNSQTSHCCPVCGLSCVCCTPFILTHFPPHVPHIALQNSVAQPLFHHP